MNAPLFDHLAALRDGIGGRLIALCEREPHLHTQRIFSAAIYGWVLLGTLMLLPYYDDVWGPESLVNRPEFNGSRWDHWLVHLSLHPAFADHSWVFIVGQLASVGLVLARRWPRLGALGVYFFTFNLYQRTGQMLDGGNNLAQLLLFYFVLMNVSGEPIRLAWAPARKAVIASSNVAFWMCRIQIVLVYLSAGVLKLNGSLWQKGMALYYILQSEAYTHPVVRELVVAFPSAAMIATYATVAFQILFVVLIWHRPARPYLIAAGIGLHLCGIAFGMGLLLFGLVMCLAYLAFLPSSLGERLRGPLTGSDRLTVTWPAHATRLGALVRAMARLDLRGRLNVTRDTHAADLTTMDPRSGETATGVGALWRVLCRVPALLPLAPLMWVAWYVGAAQSVYRRLVAAPG